MIEFSQIENYPVWESTYSGPFVDLTSEKITTTTNRNKAILNIESTNCLILDNYLKSNQFKINVINTIKSYSFINKLYPNDFLEKMENITSIGHNFHSQPHTIHPVHLDFRTNIAQGLIYFDIEHNPLHATKIYPNYPSMDKIIESNTKFGNGILILNTHSSWHGGGNLDKDLRYFVLYSLVMNI